MDIVRAGDASLHGHVARGAARVLVAAAPLAAALAVRGGARLSARCEARGRAAVRGLVAAAGASYAGSLAVLHRVSACDVSAVLTALLSLASCLLVAQAALAAAARARAPFPRRRLSRGAATTGLLVFGGFWALASTAFIAAASLDAQLTPAGRAARAAAAAACAAAASVTTHGLVGPALQRDWRFVAPFKGGALAVALQAAAWGLTGAATLALARLARAGAVATTAAARALLAASPLLAQLLLVASLLAWRKGGATKPGAPRFAGARTCVRTLPTALLIYAPAHLTAGAAAAVVAAAPLAGSAALAVALAVYYGVTSRNDSLTRGRPWPRFRAAVAARAHAALAAWHGGCKVVWDDLSGGPTWGDGGRHSGRRPSPWTAINRPLLFGYAPHGLYPIGLIALPLLPGFRAVWPRSAPPPVPLVASAVLFSPVLRDIAAWLGARVVSRPSLARALTVDRAAALVPGGQAELVHAHALHTRRALVIVRKHAGFVRAAIDAGAALVPVLALGEGAALRDGLPMPALKAAAVRALGFPVPFLLAGRGWVTPLPRRGTPLTFVIGPPVTAPAGVTGDAAARAAHAAFYEALRALYQKHAPSVPGYEGVALEWADDGPPGWKAGAG